MAETMMIQAENLTKRYGDIVAVNRVSFRVRQGEILGFLGPNGAGKTTTMRILTCFFPPTSGSATINGYDVFSQSLDVRRSIGYLPEGVPLYGDMRVSTYLGFVANLKGVSPGDRAREVRRVIDACSLEKAENRIIRNLSKGYRQRVGLAQALIGDPKLLILDEPTVGLDPTQRIEIQNLIRELAGQRTVILSTHILPEVEKTCERVLVINNGEIVADGTPSELSRRFQRGTVLSVRVRGPQDQVKAALEQLEGVMDIQAEGDGSNALYQISTAPETDLRAVVAREVVTRGWDLLALYQEEMSLEDIFVQLVTDETSVESTPLDQAHV